MHTDFLNGSDDPRSELKVVLNFTHDPWQLYSLGYLEAANALVEGIENGNIRPNKQDQLAYPIAFLYRHHIELKVKQLYLKTCHFQDVKAALQPTHTLLGNWLDFKSNFTRASERFGMAEDTSQHLQLVESQLRKLSEFDSTSFTFRYPVDKNGINPLIDRDYLHLGELRDFVIDLSRNLEYVDLQISMWMHIETDWFSHLEFFEK